MNSITLLVIGAPAVLAVVAFKLHSRAEERIWAEKEEELRDLPPHPTLGDWQWPDRSWAHSRTGEK